jgi:hypothetical protein
MQADAIISLVKYFTTSRYCRRNMQLRYSGAAYSNTWVYLLYTHNEITRGEIRGTVTIFRSESLSVRLIHEKVKTVMKLYGALPVVLYGVKLGVSP